MCHPAAAALIKANVILVCNRRAISSRDREILVAQYKALNSVGEQVQRRANMLMMGAECLSYEKRLNEFGTCSPAK